MQVKDAVAIYPLFAFLALRFAIASGTLAPPRRGPFRAGPAGSRRGLAGGLSRRGYALQTAGLERTTVSSTGFITGMYVVLTPLIALVLFRDRIARRRLGRRRARDARARAARRRSRRLGRRRPARARRRGRLLAADRADGALRTALRRGRVHARRDAGGVRGARVIAIARGDLRSRAAGRSGARCS